MEPNHQTQYYPSFLGADEKLFSLSPGLTVAFERKLNKCFLFPAISVSLWESILGVVAFYFCVQPGGQSYYFFISLDLLIPKSKTNRKFDQFPYIKAKSSSVQRSLSLATSVIGAIENDLNFSYFFQFREVFNILKRKKIPCGHRAQFYSFIQRSFFLFSKLGAGKFHFFKAIPKSSKLFTESLL